MTYPPMGPGPGYPPGGPGDRIDDDDGIFFQVATTLRHRGEVHAGHLRSLLVEHSLDAIRVEVDDIANMHGVLESGPDLG